VPRRERSKEGIYYESDERKWEGKGRNEKDRDGKERKKTRKVVP
jgi:hypothetical protein